MKRVETFHVIPQKSIIANGFESIDYADTFKVTKQTSYNIDKITTEIFRISKLGDRLMKLRDSIVKIVGLQTCSDKPLQEASYYPIGSRAMMFTVIDRNDNEIVMAENDTHLKFRTSVLIDRKSTDVADIYLTTIVHYNNFFGRFYFFFVKPFHKMLLKVQLKNIL